MLNPAGDNASTMSKLKTVQKTAHQIMGHLVAIALAYGWSEVVKDCYRNQGAGFENYAATFVFFAVLIVCCLGVLATVLGSMTKKVCFGYVPAGTLAAFALQFPFYMWQVATIYPRACTFTLFTTGTDFSGQNAALMKASTGAPFSGRHVNVECNIKICAFGASSLCTHGGRELFSTLCHSSPLLFLYIFYAVLDVFEAEDVTMPTEHLTWFINIVDIQDFFLLFLEDDIIKNYWGRDSCEQWGCTGNSNHLWRFCMFFFLTSSLVTVLFIFIEIWQTHSRKSGGYDVTPTRPDGLEHREEDPAQSPNWITVSKAVLDLLFQQLPFLIIRVVCSHRYGIAASTLAIMNLVRCYIDVILICSCGVEGTYKKFPFMNYFLKKHEDQPQSLDGARSLSSLTPA